MNRSHLGKNWRLALGIVFCLTTLMASSAPSFAHKIRIFAWEEGQDIITESKFSGGRSAQNVTIQVTTPDSEAPILSGKTNKKGIFRFPIPETKVETLNIIVDSGDGHKAIWKHDLEQKLVHVKTINSTTKTPSPSPSAPSPSQTSNEELVKRFEHLLDVKLAPIKKQLIENKEKKVTVQDILGGLGYIFGLLGIVAYSQSKKGKGCS